MPDDQPTPTPPGEPEAEDTDGPTWNDLPSMTYAAFPAGQTYDELRS